jgi:hypothetical protein
MPESKASKHLRMAMECTGIDGVVFENKRQSWAVLKMDQIKQVLAMHHDQSRRTSEFFSRARGDGFPSTPMGSQESLGVFATIRNACREGNYIAWMVRFCRSRTQTRFALAPTKPTLTVTPNQMLPADFACTEEESLCRA